MKWPEKIITTFLAPNTARCLPASILSIYVHNALKLYARWIKANADKLVDDPTASASSALFLEFERLSMQVVLEGFERLSTSDDLEVQERV